MRSSRTLTLVLGTLLATCLGVGSFATPAEAATIKDMRAAVLKMVNAERAKVGCKPLRANAALRRAAQAHTVRMADAKTMAHQLPGEADPASRITSAGYVWREVGENVAYGYATPAKVMNAWMHSKGHRANILRCSFRDLGVGIVKRGRTVWWTQDFGRR